MEEVSRSDRGDDESPSSEVPGGWCPRQLGFKPYSQLMNTSSKFKALRVVVRRPVVARLTKHLVETYQACNAEFKYAEELNPKRFLTSPADGVLNEGHDNTNSDLILSVNYVLINSQTQQRYIVKDMLGHGTFGQVAKCWVSETNSFVAVKIIKNQPAYYQQAWVEVSILATLNKKFDPEDKHHIVRIYDYFVFQRHLCISFELLDTNLYELIKINNFRGLSLSIVQLFSKQILRGLSLMKDAGIVHCDLKPENILLCTRKPAEIKIIDFGSACMEDRTVYSYIQSRYYRSPEVLLGSQYNTAIDMWSFGCIVAELFLGLPLFPGASEFDLLKRMIRILGGQPPDYLLKESKNTSKFFKSVGIGSVDHVDAGPVSVVESSAYQALTEDEYQAREKKKPVIGKEYFNYMDLEGIVAAYPYRKNLPEPDILKEKQARLALIDFLRGLIEFDPARRWSPFQAAKHPFVTGEPFTCPYKPLPETPHVPVSQIFKVDHHPGGGHWFAAGFSPNVRGHSAAMHTGQHHQVPPYAHGNSYGSLGSHNSYNDCNGLGSSYGSYGENFNAFTVFSPAGPSAMNIHAQGGMSMVGTSPDARWRAVHLPQGLGVSPSMGNLTALPLGTSPSQFTPPGSFTQLGHSSPSQFTPPGSFTQLGHSSPSQFTPPGSFTQLGHYGSPARGSNLGSPLGKGVAASNFNRRQSWGYAENPQYQEGSPYSHPRGHFFMGNCSSQGEGNPHLYGDPSHMPLKSYDSSMKFLQAKRIADENLDASVLPDPADWDPNYSDEQLLQDDSSDASSIASNFSRAVHINQGTTSYPQMFGVIGRFNHDSHTNSNPSVPRPNVPGQGYSKPDTWSPHNYMPPGPPGYGRSMPQTPMFLQQSSPTSPSRLGQIPIQRSNQGRSGTIHGNEGTHMKLQPSSFGYSPGNPHSPRGSSSFNNGNPWGRRTNPLVNIPPSPRGKKDYGRIA